MVEQTVLGKRIMLLVQKNAQGTHPAVAYDYHDFKMRAKIFNT